MWFVWLVVRFVGLLALTSVAMAPVTNLVWWSTKSYGLTGLVQVAGVVFWSVGLEWLIRRYVDRPGRSDVE